MQRARSHFDPAVFASICEYCFHFIEILETIPKLDSTVLARVPMEILMRDRNATTEGSNLLTRHSILSPVLIPIYFPYRVPFLPCSNRFSVSYVPSVARVSAPFSSANANNAARIKLFGRFHRNHCESRPVLVSIFETIL